MDTNDIQPPDPTPAERSFADRPINRDEPFDRKPVASVRKSSHLWIVLIVIGGFVLVSCAGVIVVAGLASTMLLPQLDKAKEDVARTKAVSIAQVAEKYYLDHGQYPANLQVLTQPDPQFGNQVPLQPDQILDPWNQPYQYSPPVPPNTKPRVWTTTPKGKTISNY